MRSLLAAVTLSLFAVVPAVAAPCPGTVSFQDGFTTANPAWNTAASDSAKATDGGGKFEITFLTVAKGRAEQYQGDAYGDANLCATFGTPATDKLEDQTGGLVFWAVDYTSYYVFQIIPSGQFVVSRLIAGGRWLNPIAWTPSDAIKKGVGVTNTLMVQMKGTNATFFINGTQVGTMSGTPATGGSLVGFYVSSSNTSLSTWDVTDFSVSKP